MSRRIHIIGMGVTGCLLAQRLEEYGVPFTWEDNDSSVSAWPASTGAIYPGGSEKFGPDEECRRVWESWFDNKRRPAIPGLVERCSYVFNHKQPPHEGEYNMRETPHGLRIADGVWGYQLNAQFLVSHTRREHALARRPIDFYKVMEPTAIIIRAHGFTERLSHVYWGWTRLVHLKYDESIYGTERPQFYFRKGRYIMAYAYPVPGTQMWYSGSSIIKQTVPKKLDMEPKYDRWKTNFLELSGGAVEIASEGDFLEGWRPAAAKEDTAWVRRKGNVLTVRPLWNSGIRHFPKQWAAIATQLGLVP